MYLIVGSGLSGAVLAERITATLGEKVIVLEKREHIGGNCYDYVDDATGIRLSKYGAHLFHTNSERVWEYINRFSEWSRWEHKVLSYVDKKFVSVPVNITTVNELCNEHIQNQAEMNEYMKRVQEHYEDGPKNSEEMALSRVGKELYEKMFKPYTVKQWNKSPKDLDASVLARIPIRYDFDTRYFSDKYQALPKHGYTEFIKSVLSNPLIEVHTATDFEEYRKTEDLTKFKKIFYTGPIDEYFKNENLEKLEYRSIEFTQTTYKDMNYYQPNSVVNYPELEYPFTRIIEYKHFLNQSSPHTVIVSEITTDKGEPYYPVPTEKNMSLYDKYKQLAIAEEREKNVHFVGRLANYKYFNMDQAIENALELFDTIFPDTLLRTN
jgi:UDP-galactopyranose mutase